jgi:DNA gyrase subunit A
MWSPDKFVLFATKDGTVKKTALEAFKNYRKDGIIAINIEDGNDLVDVVLTNGNSEICFATREGMCLRCVETDIRAMGRGAAGVRGIRLDEGDSLVALTAVEPGTQLLVVSEKGLGKRTPFEDYRLINRGGKGVKTMSITDKTGKVVAAIAVHEDDELMLITSKGQNVRIRVGGDKAIRETGRVAQGVKLMDLKKDEVIQDVTTVISDAEEEELVEEMGSGISIVEQGVEPEDGSIVDEGTRSEEESS